MKKNILLFILFLSFNQISKAQSRLHLADSNAVWSMLNIQGYIDINGIHIEYSRNDFLITNTDSIINGNRYSILYSRYGRTSTNDSSLLTIGYLGEDSLHRVIIILNDSSKNSIRYSYIEIVDSLYNKPLILADFSISMTDSFLFYDNIYGVVEYNYKDEVRGDSLKIQRIRLNKNNVIQTLYYDFYERVGNLREGVLYPFLKSFENGYQLICYKENDIELAPDSCDFTLNLNEKDYSNNQFDISTNIINNYLLINFNSLVNVNQATIILYDLNGKEILNKNLEVNNNLCFIPLENLINGLYILQIKIPYSKVDIRKKIILAN